MPEKILLYIPEPPDKYKGNQVIITSDRILFNAKSDSILLFSKQAIVLSASGEIHFNSDGKCIIGSPRIELGLKATEPILLGNKTTDLLKELMSKLNILTDALGDLTLTLGDAEYPLTQINTPAKDLSATIKKLSSQIDSIKSKNNFTN